MAGRTDYYGAAHARLLTRAGPIWTAVTLAAAVFFAATAGGVLASAPRAVDVGRLAALLSFVLLYLAAAAGGGWAALRAVGADSLQLAELAALLGYSLAVFVPAVVGARAAD